MERGKIKFSWDIHYKCNFRCPYCWFYKEWANMSRRNLYLSPDEWMAHWKRIHSKYGEVRIEIVGGEPFIYPNFIELIKKLSSIHSVKITTNLSGDIERFVKELSPERVDLDLNFHILFIDLDKVIKKTLILKNAGFKAGICYLAYPPQMGKIEYLSRRFKEAGINFALAAFWGEYNGKKYPESYSQAEREMMRPYLGDIDRINYHLDAKSPRGRLCNAGYAYASIHGDGNVVRCGPLADKSISNILDENFKLLAKPAPCESDFCPCNEYICLVNDPEKDASDNYSKNIDAISVIRDESNIFLANKELNKKETDEHKIILESRPLRLGVIVTNYCNLRCIMCTSSRHDGAFTFPLSVLSKIKPLLPYLERIDWQGGEFFGFKYIREFFYGLKNYPQITHGITTNGLLLEEEWIRILLELNTDLTFSIDSPLQETYEYIRRGGRYNILVNNLNLILDLEQKFGKRLKRGIVAVVMKSNLGHLSDFVPFAQNYGFQSLNFSPVMSWDNEENIFTDVTDSDIEYFEKMRYVLEGQCKELNINFVWKLPRPEAKRELTKQDDLAIPAKKELYCNYPWKTIWICAERQGDVFSDCWCRKPVGNILQEDLLDIWNNAKMQDYRKKISANDVSICNRDCISSYCAAASLKYY